MKHLTVDQITEFVSLTRMDADSLKLAADVTTHIRSCQACLHKVRAYQLVADGMKHRMQERLRQQMVLEASTIDPSKEESREVPGADS